MEQESIPKYISQPTKNDLKQLVGRLTNFYSDLLENERFDGVGEILEIVDEKESFLENHNLYQIVRMKVRFLLNEELVSHNIPIRGGYFNDPFINKSFTTHKFKKILLKEEANDKDICTLDTRKNKQDEEIDDDIFYEVEVIEVESENDLLKDNFEI